MTEEQHMTIDREVRSRLVSNALWIIDYVALGKVMPKELAAKYGITEAEAERICNLVAKDLQARLQKAGGL
jgi:hypothetical protein